jgi:hypothetical protein
LLQAELPALASARPTAFSPAVLAREGARLKGELILNSEDILKGRRFSDAVARGGWPMEYWDGKKGVQYGFAEEGLSFDIPLRALRSANIKNLWAAGRLISADSRALSSVRVMGTSMATGEAAGRAAARECL